MSEGTTEVHVWPELNLEEWTDTLELVHLWSQIVGKLRLALEPYVNHWWNVALYVSARGLTTSIMHYEGLGLEAQLDFVEHCLELRRSDGELRRIPLESGTIADFYEETTRALGSMDVFVNLYPRPVEMPVVVRFDEDRKRREYDGDAARRLWHALVEADRVMKEFRARFLGKVSPVHFFWGAPDLACTRFSGRRAPRHPGGIPNCPDRVQVLAYSHEVSSCGFWFGGSSEGSFYSYAYPVPEGFAGWPVQPGGAYYDLALGEFLLPYNEVRTARHPDSVLLEFFQSTYDAAAELADWDRESLEREDTE